MMAKMLQHPVPALIWECWRLTRRWYLWTLPAVFGIDLFFMSQAKNLVQNTPPTVRFDLATAYGVVAPSVFIVNFAIAIFATLFALSVGGRSGFPLAFEYRLPLRTSVLVAVPMLTLASLCASLYFIPMLLCRLLFDVPFPLLPAGVLLGTLVVILLASVWATTSTTARTATTLFAIFNSFQLFALLDPINSRRLSYDPSVGVPRFNPDIIALTPVDYALLIGISLLLFALTLASIRKQRYGEAPLEGFTGLVSARESTGPSRLAALLERTGDLLALPCPVAAPWRAELWLELKRQGLPILLLGAGVALSVPLLYALGFTPGAMGYRIDYLFPLGVFLNGIGIAIFNRRQLTAGYMSAFEGTRGMSTIAFALLQMLAIGASILCGMLLVCLSVHFSSQFLVDAPGALAVRMEDLFAPDGNSSALLLLSETVMQLVVYLSAIALFACVHTGSVVWGRVLPYGAGIVAIYGLIFAYRVQSGSAELEDIKQHMWGFAAIVLLLTLIALGRTLYLKILTLRASLLTLACWAVFVVCSLYSLSQRNIVLANQASELQALNAALLLLPFTLFVLLFWSYDRLRHR